MRCTFMGATGAQLLPVHTIVLPMAGADTSSICGCEPPDTYSWFKRKRRKEEETKKRKRRKEEKKEEEEEEKKRKT